MTGVVAATLLAGGVSAAGATSEPPAPLAVDQVEDPIARELRDLLKKFIERTQAPGVTASLVTRDGKVYGAAWGRAGEGEAGSSSLDMRVTSRMMSGSVGKMYFAALFMMLVEDGVLDLDAPIEKVLKDRPWFKDIPNAHDLTLRMLMRHQSGIPEHIELEEFQAALRADPQKVWKPEELLAFVAGKPPLFKAGGEFSYADTNYILAGVVVEAVTGRDLYSQLRERILVPQDLMDTDPNDRPYLRGLVSGYTKANGIFPVPEIVATNETYKCNPQVEWTGGGLVLTAPDLARFASALFAGHVVSEKSLKQMLDGVQAPLRIGNDARYGLGVIIWKERGRTYYGHSGWFPGYVTKVMYDVQTGAAMAIQVNTDQGVWGSPVNALADEILRLADQ